ncbi:MAG: hypothetical protein DRP35_01800 [Candidatus Zixiibacteriota bacterium]|nr:MAG: hypothetical protein DRP35_01800 [candidate division Zixibacteria bacterium]
MTEFAKEKIIIIDDEKRMCDSLATLLINDGYQVDTYQSSHEAANAINKSRVDLVITDIKMPELDGLQILEVVKKVDDGIPVVLMTGYGSMESAVDAISLGAYDYLLKPVEFAHFELVVKRALEKRRSELSRLELLEELKISNIILNRRINELNALYEAGKSIGSSVNLKELLKQIVALASNVTEAQVGSIMLLDNSQKYMTIEAAIGLSREVIDKTKLPIGESIAGFVAKTGEPLIIDDIEQHKHFKRNNQERYGAASLLCTPLKIKNKVIGVINMANKQDNANFSKNDLRLLSTFAVQAAIAVDDANQFEKNRRMMEEYKILHEINAELYNIISINDFRIILVDKLKKIFPIDYSILFRWDADNNILIPQFTTGEIKLPMTASGKINLNVANKNDLILEDYNLKKIDLSDIISLSEKISKSIKEKKSYPQSSSALMAIPIKKRGEPEFVFCLGAVSDKPYSSEDISLARLVVSQGAFLFEKEQSLLNATRLLTMGNMISEISHDLRKPLTSIKGGLQVIRLKLPKDLQDSDLFKITEEEVHRLNELVKELVDFSNPNKYQTEKIDLRSVISRALELVDPDIKKKKIESSMEFEDLNWDIIVNKNQILETLLNLFINAIDAMPDGGELKVKGFLERPSHRKVDFLAVKISDNGCGISKKNISKVFDRYFTTKQIGTGLGLAVVERIMSAHNGTIALESTEGKGTIFTLYFPYDI